MAGVSRQDGPILVTGAAGEVGSVGREVTRLLLADGFRVRAMVRKRDGRAEALGDMGAEVVVGDLTDLDAMHRVIAGCRRLYFGMSVSPTYLEATVNTAAVALHQGVDAVVNMSQMTVSQMSVTATTASPQQKLHWLSEQALAWSRLPVVTVRPTMFLEGFFLLFAAPGVRGADELAMPMGAGKTSPISSLDVARVVAAILRDPAPHIGNVYNLTGPESADLHHYAAAFSDALGRSIRYRDVPLDAWSANLREAGIPPHVVSHVSTMATLTRDGRYDRMTDEVFALTGEKPVGMRAFVERHADAFEPA